MRYLDLRIDQQQKLCDQLSKGLPITDNYISLKCEECNPLITFSDITDGYWISLISYKDFLKSLL